MPHTLTHTHIRNNSTHVLYGRNTIFFNQRFKFEINETKITLVIDLLLLFLVFQSDWIGYDSFFLLFIYIHFNMTNTYPCFKKFSNVCFSLILNDLRARTIIYIKVCVLVCARVLK